MDTNSNIFLYLLFILTLSIVVTPGAFGELILEAGLKGTYEDNITGASSDVDKEGDFYTTLSFSANGYNDISDKTYLFLRGDIGSYLYINYNELNAAILGISTGISKELSDAVTLQLALSGRVKSYSGKDRDSSAYGGYLELKQQITPKVWLREGYEYEKNEADSEDFSYKGHSMGLWSGYLLVYDTMLNLGYNYLLRNYEDPSAYKITSHTLWAGMTRLMLQKLYLNLGYSRQFNDTNLPDTDYGDNNIYSIGMTYAF